MSEANRVGHLVEISSDWTGAVYLKGRYALVIGDSDGQGECEVLLLDDTRPELPDELCVPDGLVPQRGYLNLKKRFSVPGDCLGETVAVLDAALLETVLKRLVFAQTRQYYRAVHRPKQQQPFIPGKSRVNYAGRVYDESELTNLMDSALDFYLTADRYERNFCAGLATLLQQEGQEKVHPLTVNSGSSANLLAVTTLTSHKLGELRLREGDEVICVAAGFPTSIAPILQQRLVPVFVDIEMGSYNIDPAQLEEALSERTRAIFVAHTLGNPFDLDAVLSLAEKHGLWVLEDNCDALGARYTLKREYRLIKDKRVSGTRFTGTIGHLGTSSFYPAHQITMGEGGALYTCDQDLYRIALSYRDWGRDCICDPGKDATCKMRFGWQLGKLPQGYDHKYTYSHLGYNLKITDLQAAIGAAQLEKLPGFAEARFRNWQRLQGELSDLERYFHLPHHLANAVPSPFGFPLTVREGAGFSRDSITAHLEMNNIQTRTVFAGNMLRQPALTEQRGALRIRDSRLLFSDELSEEDYRRLPVTETVMASTFWVGVYPGLTEEMVRYVVETIRSFVARY